MDSVEKKKKTSLAIRLKTLRAEHDLTQAEVSKALGISQQTYSKYESKDTVIDSEVIKGLCALYGVSADYLLGIDTPATQVTASKKSAIIGDDIDIIVQQVLSKLVETEEK